MKNQKTMAFLSLVLAGILGTLAYDNWQTENDELAEKSKSKLVDIEFADVSSVEVLSGSSEGSAVEKIVLERDDATWSIVSPIKDKADKSAVEAFIKSVTEYKYTKVVGNSKAEWAKFGLGEEARTIQLHTPTGKKAKVYLGSKAPVGYNCYSATDAGESVYLGSQHLLMSTEKDLNHFRDKNIFNIDESGLNGLSYFEKSPMGADTRFAIHEGEKGWTIASTGGAKATYDADKNEVRNYVDVLNGIKATGFVDSADEKLLKALANPDIVIEALYKDGRRMTTFAAKVENQFYLTFDAKIKVFLINEVDYDKLARSVLSFRDKKIFTVTSEDVTSVIIDGSAYNRVEGEWYSATDAAKVDANKDKRAESVMQANVQVSAFLVDLLFTKAVGFYSQEIANKLAGQKPPLHAVTLKLAGENEISVKVYKMAQESSKLLLHKSGTSQVFEISNDILNSFEDLTDDEISPVAGDLDQKNNG